MCDGHGKYGHHASRFVRDKLAHLALAGASKLSHSNAQKALTSMYDSVAKEIRAMQPNEIDFEMSGCTACTLYVLGDTLYCVNTGDSRCVVAMRTDSEMCSLSPLAMSYDHAPDRMDEIERMVAAGAVVRDASAEVSAASTPTHKDELSKLADGALLTPKGVKNAMTPTSKHKHVRAVSTVRLWGSAPEFQAKGKVGGLNMTRAFGDHLMRKVGLIHNPDVEVKKLDAKDAMAIIASDGLWKVVDEHQALRIIATIDSPAEAAQELMTACENAWHDLGYQDRDDITIIVVTFALSA